MTLKHIPNLVSLFRLLLIIPFLGSLYHQAYPAAFYVFLLAGLTDSIDGWLARQFNWQTPLGRFIDPIADKLLITCSVVSLACLNILPWWLVILILLRDLTISCGAIFWHFCIEKNFDFVPSYMSKINTALQILLVGLCLIELAFSPLHPNPIPTLIILTAITTTTTYIDNAWTWGKKACFLKCARP